MYIPERQLKNQGPATMFSISRFHVLTKHLPRGTFERAVACHEADKHAKGFGRWQHLLVMTYAQLSGADSLRTVVAGFNAQASHHYHLGARAVRRSTLAEANARVSPEPFAEVVRHLMGCVQRQVRREMAPLLKLLDSTSITLKGPGFDTWTFAGRNTHTQGIKLHVLYDSARQAPGWSAFSDANVNDITAAQDLPLEAGQRYVFDKGYCDYAWWQAIDQAGSHFVTRFKRNAALDITQTRAVGDAERQVILADEIVTFRHRHNRAGHTNPYEAPLRRVTVRRADHATPLVLATNDLSSPPTQIAAHYQARWDIELFFKWIKQHLRLRRFLGRSEKAVKIQVLTALIAYLLVALERHVRAPTMSLWLFLAELRASLFQRPAVENHLRCVHQRRRRQSEFLLRQGALFA
jgi:hypothetical protein